MKLEPPRSEDLRILWIRHAAKARWTALLIALGLVIGFAVGARLGAISQPPSVQTVSRVDRVDAADTSDSADTSAPSEAARVETAEASGEAPADVAIASAPDEPTAPIPASPSSGAESEATPGQEPSPEPDREREEESQGRVVARYASVSIDSLPMHGGESGIDSGDALTMVTRGEIGAGESLAGSLRRQGISAATVHLIAKEMRKVFDFRRSRPGDRYRLGQDTDGRVLDFRYAQGPEESFYLAWEGTRYVVRKETAELRPQIAKIAGIVDSSFYDAILALGEQSALAAEFVRIFAWDIDFSRNVQPGDEFQILYERLYRRDDDGEDVYVRPGRILAGRYRGSVGEHTVVYFEDDEGNGSYFRPDGSSVERAFLAAPLEFRRISSRFTRARHHPILNVTRPHPGIDYAAPRGTPVWAVADGVVEYRGRAGASGNLVRIRHLNGYTSHYAHLASFAKDLRIGDRVEQKQVIGFVGSTGLSTGPHVCFRVKKDGRYVDPMKISSPAGAPVERARIPEFESVRDELLADLGNGSISLADEAL